MKSLRFASGASAWRTQSVVENVGVTFTPRSVVDDRWQEGFSSLVHTSFAISAAFFFWKE